MPLVDSRHPRIRFASLWKLLERRIQFHPIFVRMTGSITASLMLSQGFYWTRKWIFEQQPARDGWFWKSRDEWHLETGLSRREQETARKILRKLGFIQEKEEGMPARLSFRLDLERITQAVQPDTSGQLNWQDDVVVFELLGPPITFHRRLVEITGSVTASLMLSHTIVQTMRIISKRPDGWFWKSRDEWHLETGLSRWEQEAARKSLKELALIEEKKVLEACGGQDATHIVMYYRVNLEQLEQLLSEHETGLQANTGIECEKLAHRKVATEPTRMPVSSTLKGGERANKDADFQQTEKRETSQQKGGERTNRKVVNEPTCWHENLQSVGTFPTFPIESIDYLHRLQLQQQPAVAIETMDSCRRDDGQDLIYPRQIDQSIREAVGRRLMAECPSDAQAILDVMAHAFQTKGIPNPVGYLNSLIERAKRQAFDPLPGLAIAKSRDEQQRREAHRLENDKRIREEARAVQPSAASLEQSGYKTLKAAAFFTAFKARQEKISAPTVANSPTDARQASPLVQQKPLSKKPPTLLLSSGSKLVLLGGGR